MMKTLATLAITGAAAALLFVGGNAGAVSDSVVFSASANNPATLSLSSTDTELDCGDIVAGACTGSDSANLQVTSNAQWSLSIEDAGGALNDAVVLTSAKDSETTFTMAVVPSATSGLGNGSVSFTAGALVGYDANTRDGAYNGSFTVSVVTE